MSEKKMSFKVNRLKTIYWWLGESTKSIILLYYIILLLLQQLSVPHFQFVA